jgi:multimeric flavodoxin WrbA
LINLSEYEFIQCNGCEICTTKPCPLDKQDDYPKLEELILNHQGILIASPSYWTGPPGILKNVIDRSRDNKMPEQLWAGKIFSAIAISGLRVGGQESVINSLIIFALGHGMIIVGGVGHPWFNAPFPMGTIMYDTVDEGKPKIKFRSVKKDPIATKDSELLGKRLASFGNKLFS